jgi:hypothetical protein
MTGESTEDLATVGQLLAHLHRIEVDATAFRKLPLTPPDNLEQANGMLIRNRFLGGANQQV